MKREETFQKMKIIVPILICFLFSLLLMMQAHIRKGLWAGTDFYYGTDSGVFEYIGKGILEGRLPYVETFDHKGLVLYMLNAGALFLGGHNGIWWMELVNMFLVLFLSYQLGKKLTDSKTAALLGVLITYSTLCTYLASGNYEEYVLLPTTTALYIFLMYFKGERIKNIYLFLLGIAFALTVLVKFNLVAVWCVFCAYIFIASIWRREYKFVGRCALNFIVGILLICIPAVMFLYLRGGVFALEAFWDQVYVFNTEYAPGLIFDSYYWYIAKTFILGSNMGVISIILLSGICASVIICRWIGGKFHVEKKGVIIYCVLSLISICLAFVLVTMSRRNYSHYMLTLLPVCNVIITLGTKYLISNNTDKRDKISIRVISISILVFLCFASLYHIYKISSRVIAPDLQYDEERQQVLNIIEKESDETDEISVVGQTPQIYLASNRISASKYLYQIPIYTYRRSIIDEYCWELWEKKPKLIVYDKLVLSYYSDKELESAVDEITCREYNLIFDGELHSVYKLQQDGEKED